MAKIKPALLDAIRAKTGLSRAQVYARIKQASTSQMLPNHLAAVKVAADEGITINRYASTEELAELRRVGSPVAPPTTQTVQVTESQLNGRSKRAVKTGGKKASNQVFVVHGRDLAARSAVFDLLRAVGVKPIEWNSAIEMSRKASPYVGEILDAAFQKARAVVVLLTPDDQAMLREDLRSSTDPPFEKKMTGQARPNVLFEAGMAFSSHPDQTILVQLGYVRPFSDTLGRHILRMSNEPNKRQEFVTRLRNAGCDVDTSGTDWLNTGDFTDPDERKPQRKKNRSS